jgi:aspartyl-tRNA(Asn)/glutamyl-tRNA(Gln) amidotransferase subunit A
MYLEDLFTVGANLAGIPAMSIPCGKTKEGLPIGMQLQAAPLAEPMLLQAGHWYQTIVEYQPEVATI